MERIVHKSKNFKDAEQWDIDQQIKSTIDERLRAARELQRRNFGDNCPDVRETREVVITHAP